MRSIAQTPIATTIIAVAAASSGRRETITHVASASSAMSIAAAIEGASETRTGGGQRIPPWDCEFARDALDRMAEADLRLLRGVLREHHPRRHDGIRIERDALDALPDQPLREIGMVRRSLSADADVFPAFAARGDRHAEQRFHRIVALVECRAQRTAGVAIDAERQLCQIVRADRKAVEMIEEPIREQRVRRKLAHHDDAQPVFAASQAVLREQR